MVERINGFLGGSGSSRYSARADHDHSGDGSPVLKAVKKTIKVADWDNKAADVPFTEGTFVGYQVDGASLTAAASAALKVNSVGTDKVTFGCTTTPAAALDAFILYL